MMRAASVLVCFLLCLGGCKHQSSESRMKELLPVNDFHSEPADGTQRPKDDKERHLTPDRIHGGII